MRRALGLGRDRGSATVWLMAFAAIVMCVGVVAVGVTGAVLTRHRVENVADLTALSAAQRIGLGTDACQQAARTAAANRSVLASCLTELASDGRSGTVVVRVERSARFVLVGRRTATAWAKAGRLPG